MTTIHKYIVPCTPATGEEVVAHIVSSKEGAKILSVKPHLHTERNKERKQQVIREVWVHAVVDDEAKDLNMGIILYQTGDPVISIPKHVQVYRDTVVFDGFNHVYHVFQVIPTEHPFSSSNHHVILPKTEPDNPAEIKVDFAQSERRVQEQGHMAETRKVARLQADEAPEGRAHLQFMPPHLSVGQPEDAFNQALLEHPNHDEVTKLLESRGPEVGVPQESKLLRGDEPITFWQAFNIIQNRMRQMGLKEVLFACISSPTAYDGERTTAQAMLNYWFGQDRDVEGTRLSRDVVLPTTISDIAAHNDEIREVFFKLLQGRMRELHLDSVLEHVECNITPGETEREAAAVLRTYWFADPEKDAKSLDGKGA